jgi:hypothetical protein
MPLLSIKIFLGYIVLGDGICMDEKKIQTIVDWIAPSSVRDVQYFLDFAKFYRISIKDYSKIAAPLTRLTRKDKFVWNEKAKEASKVLKKAFTSVPIFVHANSSKPFILEANVLDFALGSVLSQYDEDGQLHPIAYCSRKFSTIEINYEIHDKKLLAIIDTFKEWRHFLKGLNIQLQYIRITKNLNIS